MRREWELMCSCWMKRFALKTFWCAVIEPLLITQVILTFALIDEIVSRVIHTDGPARKLVWTIIEPRLIWDSKSNVRIGCRQLLASSSRQRVNFPHLSLEQRRLLGRWWMSSRDQERILCFVIIKRNKSPHQQQRHSSESNKSRWRGLKNQNVLTFNQYQMILKSDWPCGIDF